MKFSRIHSSVFLCIFVACLSQILPFAEAAVNINQEAWTGDDSVSSDSSATAATEEYPEPESEFFRALKDVFFLSISYGLFMGLSLGVTYFYARLVGLVKKRPEHPGDYDPDATRSIGWRRGS